MPLSDPDDFARAFDAHAPGAYAVALRVLRDPQRAQDVVQDVFLRLWRSPDRFDEGRGELGSYIRLMARSRAIDAWREHAAASRAQDRVQDQVAHEPAAGVPTPEDELIAGERRSAVRAALRRLPAAQREAAVLAYYAGMTADEISRRLQIPLGTAKSRIRLGLARLASDLGPAAA